VQGKKKGDRAPFEISPSKFEPQNKKQTEKKKHIKSSTNVGRGMSYSQNQVKERNFTGDEGGKVQKGLFTSGGISNL